MNFIVGGRQAIRSKRKTRSTPKTRDLCGGLNSQSLSPGKIIGFTSLTPGPTRWSSTP
jgi:hypothetical protein